MQTRCQLASRSRYCNMMHCFGWPSRLNCEWPAATCFDQVKKERVFVILQELLDDLAGLSGDSYHTAASQQAAELSDADSLHTIVPACVLPARQHAPSGVDDVRRSASEASPAKAVKGADGVSPWAASRSHGRSHLLHLPPDVLDLVILQLHPRDWCVALVRCQLPSYQSDSMPENASQGLWHAVALQPG